MKKTIVNGWLFIPSTMIFCALTWATASSLPAIMLKSMGVPNTIVGLSSFLGLPIALRFIFGPFVDKRGTKRAWTLNLQVVITGFMLLIAALSGLSIIYQWDAQPWFLVALMSTFALLSFVSAFNDLAWGGFFLASVDERDKALFTGVNSAFIRVANIFSHGFMVMLAGRIQAQTGLVMAGWAVCFLVFGILQLVLVMYHRRIYPHPVLDVPLHHQDQLPFLQVFALFLKEPRAYVILAFIALYRVDQGLLNTMKVPFLLDPPEVGGLGLPLEQIGTINGIYGVIAMICGGVLGGLTIRRYGLRPVIWPFAFLLTIPNAGFIWLAYHPMYTTITLLGAEMNLWALVATIFEAFGYGLGFSSFAFFIVEASRGPHRATYFALLNGVMSLSWLFVSGFSGFVQQAMGYFWLFVTSVIVSVPGIALIAWLPLKELEQKGKEEDAARHGKATVANEQEQ